MFKKKISINKSIFIILIFVIILILFLIISIELSSNDENKQQPKENNTKELLTDKISPLENQGLILEIYRMRNRMILDKVLNIGFSWRVNPKNYVNINIDNLDYPEKIITKWDTIYNEFRLIKDAAEEQEKSEITIEIINKNGIFNNKQQELINLIYNYRTGRWSGDDYLKDKDGYGHYIGDSFEIWFNIYQTDFDNDYIPYWTEVNVLGTDPTVDDSNLDPDKDGIPTSWEWKWDYDPFKLEDHEHLDPDVDGLSNSEEYYMRKYFADPFAQDIYVEIDFMEKKIFNAKTSIPIEVKQIMIERFTENNINLYIDDGWPTTQIHTGGDIVPYIKKINWESGDILRFYKNYFQEERRGIFRYALICNNAKPIAFSGNTMFNKYDTIVIGIQNLNFLPPRLKRIIYASTFLHELGHTLGIEPYTIEGCDNISFLSNFVEYKKTWGNYKSVMNYLYIFNPFIVDYSHGASEKYDQDDWKLFYLPYFDMENNIIIEPGIIPPAKNKVINENLTPEFEDWKVNKNISEKLNFEELFNTFPYNHEECNWLVFTTNNENSNITDFKIYVKPLLPISSWSLVYHGEINDLNIL
jgi:hypothetical protein